MYQLPQLAPSTYWSTGAGIHVGNLCSSLFNQEKSNKNNITISADSNIVFITLALIKKLIKKMSLQ